MRLIIADETITNRAYVAELKVYGTLSEIPPDYQIDGISVKSLEGDVLSEIPQGSFKISVQVRNHSSDTNALLFVATYSNHGRFISLDIMSLSAGKGQVEEIDVIRSNTDGKIQIVKAFVIRSLTKPVPLARHAVLY